MDPQDRGRAHPKIEEILIDLSVALEQINRGGAVREIVLEDETADDIMGLHSSIKVATPSGYITVQRAPKRKPDLPGGGYSPAFEEAVLAFGDALSKIGLGGALKEIVFHRGVDGGIIPETPRFLRWAFPCGQVTLRQDGVPPAPIKRAPVTYNDVEKAHARAVAAILEALAVAHEADAQNYVCTLGGMLSRADGRRS